MRVAGVVLRRSVQERGTLFEEWAVHVSQRIWRLLLRDCDEYIGDAQLQWAQQLFEGAGVEEECSGYEGEATWGSLQQ